VAPISETERDMQRLEAALKQLEAEYNMYFSGRLPKPPWETRSRVEALVKRYDHGHLHNYGDRFRFNTLQTRFHVFIDLWDKSLRAREEGRSGAFGQKPKVLRTEVKPPEDRVMHVAAFKDPLREMEKLHELYNSLSEARKEIGQSAVPFHKFADLVKTQVQKLTSEGHSEVAFRVAVKDGKVNFTARVTKDESD
jgi:hypothetical protein